ncbi:putative FAD-linked oxidoreductase [bacterium HR12]|nr:putative FAD-linked oxidoreductase [bacterium HR12]
MDLIHPHTKADVVEVLRRASAERRRLLVCGGRTHLDKGNPCEVDAELWTTMLDGLVAYEPAEMVAVVGAGMRVGDLQRRLGEHGQEWPVDARPEATVGGVLAAGVSSPRRLSVGAVRDSVLELEIVTGDGRLVRSGARTVKNVTGYDLHKLLVGSLGTLGVIVQVALRVRPLPAVRRTVRVPGDLETARRLLQAVPLPTAVLATADGVELRLEGWPEQVDEQTAAALAAFPEAEAEDDLPFPARTPWLERPVVVEAAVPPSRLGALLEAASGPFGALVGVGICWVGLDDPDGELRALRERAAALGGIAPVVRGPGVLGDAPLPALDVQRRLKAAFDPAGVLAPGRFWGGWS